MGKNSNELWDDSTLIDAFDQAVSKYKKMHGKARGANLSIAEVISNAEDNGSISLEKAEEESSDPSATNNAAPGFMTETSIPGNGSENQNLNMTSHLEESFPDRELPLDRMAEASENKKTNVESVYSNETYNELLSEYHKIEDQRQTLLHQLHQASYWGSHPCDLNATYPTLQGDPSSVSGSHYGYQGYYPDHLLPWGSYSYGYHASHAASNMPLPSSHVHETPEAMETNQSKEKVDGNHTQAITKAYEVLSSSKLEPSASNLHQVDNKRKSETQATCESLCLPRDSEIDLSVVLSAWYTAGFHTGRYLLEQSQKKGQR